jgi:hypothetical protein
LRKETKKKKKCDHGIGNIVNQSKNKQKKKGWRRTGDLCGTEYGLPHAVERLTIYTVFGRNDRSC